MAVGFPTKANWAAGDILTAAQMDDLAGTLNTVPGLITASSPTANPLLNSQMNVWQRGTSFSFAGSAAGAYTADRWYFGGTNASQAMTISRQATNDTTNLPNIQYCTRVQKNSGQTGNGAVSFGQSIETLNSVPLAGKQVTFSFYARAGANYSAASNLLTVNLLSGTGTDQNAQAGAGFSGVATAISIAATLTTTWQRFTGTATLGSNITELAAFVLLTTTGTAGANDYFEITGVQINTGSSVATFAPNGTTYEAELAACQRYYWRSTAAITGNSNVAFGSAYSTSAIFVPFNFPVTMRSIPSSVDYSALQANDGAAGNTINTLAMNNTTSSGTLLNITSLSSAVTQFRPYLIIGTTNGYLGFSAEL